MAASAPRLRHSYVFLPVCPPTFALPLKREAFFAYPTGMSAPFRAVSQTLDENFGELSIRQHVVLTLGDFHFRQEKPTTAARCTIVAND